MNKLVKVFAMAVMLVIGGQAMAQTRGAMFLGASFPMSDFAEFDGFNEFPLTATDLDADDAGAGIGFNAGLKWYFNVGVKGLGVLLSVDGFYNGPNSDLKTLYRKGEAFQIYDYDNEYDSFTYKSTPQYINVPAMLGMNYIYHFNPNLAVYVEAGAGGNLRLITDMENVYQTHVSSVHGTYKAITSYDKAFSFAYQAGVGIEVAKNLVIGCSFYDLGAAQVKGERTLKQTDGTPPFMENKTEYQEYGTVHPIMILGRIGFCF